MTSRWPFKNFKNERAAHARYMATPMRPIRHHTEAKAREYAEWLMRRDGLDLETLAAQARDTHNATRQPTQHKRRGVTWTENHPEFIREGSKVEASIVWGQCAAGKRPKAVVFGFHRGPNVLEVRLPHWDHVSDLEEMQEAA